MSTPLRFFTLSPVDSSLPSQTAVFSPSDQVQLQLGGIRFDSYGQQRPPHHTADFIFDKQFLIPNHCRITHSHHATGLTNCSDSGKTRVNGIPLAKDQRVTLQHGDQIELGHLDEYSGNFRNTLALAVNLSTSPPAPLRQPLSSHSLISATVDVFHTLQSAHRVEEQLRAALSTTQQRLQDALDDAAAHICTPSPPLRSYGQLLEDLRRPATPTGSPSARSRSSTPPLPHSSMPSPSVSVSVSELDAGSSSLPPLVPNIQPSSASSVSESTQSPSHPHSSSPATSVLTSAPSLLFPEPPSAASAVHLGSSTTPSAPSSPKCASVRAPSLSSAASDSPSSKSALLSTTTSISVAGRAARPVDAVLPGVRAPWTMARAQLLDGPSPVRSADVATSRVLKAWMTARQALDAVASPAPRISSQSFTAREHRAGSLEVLLFRVREHWIRARGELTRKPSSVPATEPPSRPPAITFPLAAGGAHPSLHDSIPESAHHLQSRPTRPADVLSHSSSANDRPTSIGALRPPSSSCPTRSAFHDPLAQPHALIDAILDFFTRTSYVFASHAQPATYRRTSPPHYTLCPSRLLPPCTF
ncbi:hypothetical protein CF326_g8734 [Tilletia indica]|nr:hypothetical protein CF326_g8734 [Tilletia indica]